ncbi:acyl-ACP thioesterase domain-containing protein [Clostridium sp. JN-9]|uniref:acyl-[acyl-carrier-protein] thioesterase n=1 Tax=Clostridium sp. JN-9 TaxID=2507159 RepID=UPI000FFE3084|nr:acyl-ACP thioesterase domain-containing protein [Clostridium sp. JN-9]QAT41526.1 acyl-ACP thioesterase [Clostridium sp. JN-9]
MSGKVTTKEYEIHYYEIDYKKRLLLTSLMNFFNDIVNHQSEDFNVGIDYMAERKKTWVLYKWSINIKRYPLLEEIIRIKTVPSSFNKFFGYRKYEVYDSKDDLIMTADSVWFLIDIEKRKPIRISDDMYLAYGISKDDNADVKIKKIKSPEQTQYEKTFNVRYSDIDTNKHVNNVNYVAWALETVPKEIVLDHSLNNIIVTYEKETTYGDIVKSKVQVIDNQDGTILCKHKIEGNNGTELTIMETNWTSNK